MSLFVLSNVLDTEILNVYSVILGPKVTIDGLTLIPGPFSLETYILTLTSDAGASGTVTRIGIVSRPIGMSRSPPACSVNVSTVIAY